VYLVTIFRLVKQIFHVYDTYYVSIRILFVLVFGYVLAMGGIFFTYCINDNEDPDGLNETQISSSQAGSSVNKDSTQKKMSLLNFPKWMVKI